MKKILLVMPLALIMAAGCGKQTSTPSNTTPTTRQTMQQQMDAVGTSSSSTMDAAMGTVKSFTVVGKNYSFTPNTITVKKGDTVKITFQNDDGFHNFLIDEFKVKSATIQSGKTTDVQFVADKTGTFQFYCSIGDHRAMGMYGNLIVQ